MEAIQSHGHVAPIARSPLDSARGRRKRHLSHSSYIYTAPPPAITQRCGGDFSRPSSAESFQCHSVEIPVR
jgi:hypothetical protein